MASRGRFKGWRSETTVARMTPEDQKKYRDFVKQVEEARKNGKELPEPPDIDVPVRKPDDPVLVRKGRKSTKPIKEATKEITGKATEETERDDEEYVTKNWWDENPSKGDIQETVIHHCSREGFCIIESNEPYWKNKIKKMHEKHPDLVIYEDKHYIDDTIRVKIPYKYMKKINVSVYTMSDEHRERMSARGKSLHQKQEEGATEGATKKTTKKATQETTKEDTEEVIVVEKDAISVITVEDEENLKKEDEKEKYSGAPRYKEIKEESEEEPEEDEDEDEDEDDWDSDFYKEAEEVEIDEDWETDCRRVAQYDSDEEVDREFNRRNGSRD